MEYSTSRFIGTLQTLQTFQTPNAGLFKPFKQLNQ
jgi:hypothetical protein